MEALDRGFRPGELVHDVILEKDTFMAFVRETAVVGGKEIILESGRLARQANGAIWIQYVPDGRTVSSALRLAMW